MEDLAHSGLQPGQVEKEPRGECQSKLGSGCTCLPRGVRDSSLRESWAGFHPLWWFVSMHRWQVSAFVVFAGLIYPSFLYFVSRLISFSSDLIYFDLSCHFFFSLIALLLSFFPLLSGIIHIICNIFLEKNS